MARRQFGGYVVNLSDLEPALPWVGLIATIALGMWRISASIAKKEAENEARHEKIEVAIENSVMSSIRRHERTEKSVEMLASSVQRLLDMMATRGEQHAAEYASLATLVKSQQVQIDRMALALAREKE